MTHDKEFTPTQYKVLKGLVYTTAEGGNAEIREILGAPKKRRPRIINRPMKHATADQHWAALCRITKRELCK